MLADASEIADEWVTLERIAHVIQHIARPNLSMSDTPEVCRSMLEDVLREGAGEIADSKEARKAISKRAAMLFHQWLNQES